LHPNFLHEDLEGDKEALGDFLENLDDKECSIIALHGNNLKKLRKLKARIDHDVAGTAKDLAME
jgi:uncharacterized Rossmann fold enzyme